MLPRKLSLAVIAALLLTSASAARANDSAAGGSGSDLVPLEIAKIRMADEDILITHEGIDWIVEAEYTFENLTKKPITLQVAFPEYGCEGGDPGGEESIMCDPKPLRYQSMRTTVDGTTVQHRQGTYKKGHPWEPRLGQVWLFDATFAPGKQTRIHHSYRVHEGEDSSGGRFVSYVTRTGATWAGKIGHARFRVRVPLEANDLGYPGDAGLAVSRQVVDVNGVKLGEITLEGRKWEPTGDLSFYFNAQPGRGLMGAYMMVLEEKRARLPLDQQCPNIVEIWTRGAQIGEPNPHDAPDPQNTIAHWAEKLAPAGLGNAQICRSYIYAYRGRDFGDPATNQYFYGSEGYKDRGWPYDAYQPNPYYSDALLTKGDHAALQLIDAIEARVNAKTARHLTASQPTPRQPARRALPKVELEEAPCGCSVFPQARALRP